MFFYVYNSGLLRTHSEGRLDVALFVAEARAVERRYLHRHRFTVRGFANQIGVDVVLGVLERSQRSLERAMIPSRLKMKGLSRISKTNGLVHSVRMPKVMNIL